MNPPPRDIVDTATVIEVPTDTCDHCGPHVRAYVYAQMKAGPISYCGSCATRYWDTLNSQALKVIDLRHTIGK